MTTADAIVLLRDALIFLVLAIIPVSLTVVMFLSRNRMLGFAASLFWAIFGAYAYTQSTTAWGDWQYYLFFASAFGMTIFSALAAYGLKEQKDTGTDKEEYIDEVGGKEKFLDDENGITDEEWLEGEPSERTKRVRERAENRRAKIRGGIS